MRKAFILILLYCFLLCFSVQGVQVIKNYTRDSTTNFPNPERGFYSEQQSTDYSPDDALDLDTLASLKSQYAMTLILREFYMPSFKNNPMLSSSMLNYIKADFATIRQARFKTILRFVYSEDSAESDAPMSVIKAHLTQLTPIIKANADVIATWQAGFIAAWGEWYYSSNNLNNNASYWQVTSSLLNILPPTRTVQIRTPYYKAALYNVKTSPYSVSTLSLKNNPRSSNYARTGLHNDCFLADDTDMGTYLTAADKTFVAQDSLVVPNGGETCQTSTYSTCAGALSAMKKYHYSYVHNDYQPDVVASWTSGGCRPTMNTNLGYRLALQSISFPSTLSSTSSISYTVVLNNIGWAAPYNPYNVKLHLVSTKSPSVVAMEWNLGWDVRNWAVELNPITLSGSLALSGSSMVSGQSYILLMSICDPYPSLAGMAEYCIRLANVETKWDASNGKHNTGIQSTFLG